MPVGATFFERRAQGTELAKPKNRSAPVNDKPGTENTEGMLGHIFTFDDFALDVHKVELRRAGTRLKPDGLVLRLLEAFVRRPGELVTKQELATCVWDGRPVSDNAISVAIRRLRVALEHERGAHEVVQSAKH